MKEQVVFISGYPIRLGQFLKCADIVSAGGAAKELIRSHLITVNGSVETRRGRQLMPGDRILVDDVCYICN
ncbi:MAG: RNA-binding S4 domain-containing protein [Desulfofustis sp.]|nr:RNA-binding S4 domain-containing protein [Desulfofustis sp.]